MELLLRGKGPHLISKIRLHFNRKKVLTQKVARHTVCKEYLQEFHLLSVPNQVLLRSAHKTDHNGNGLTHNCFFFMLTLCKECFISIWTAHKF